MNPKTTTKKGQGKRLAIGADSRAGKKTYVKMFTLLFRYAHTHTQYFSLFSVYPDLMV